MFGKVCSQPIACSLTLTFKSRRSRRNNSLEYHLWKTLYSKWTIMYKPVHSTPVMLYLQFSSTFSFSARPGLSIICQYWQYFCCLRPPFSLVTDITLIWHSWPSWWAEGAGRDQVSRIIAAAAQAPLSSLLTLTPNDAGDSYARPRYLVLCVTQSLSLAGSGSHISLISRQWEDIAWGLVW